jgi:hypothetical protein
MSPKADESKKLKIFVTPNRFAVLDSDDPRIHPLVHQLPTKNQLLQIKTTSRQFLINKTSRYLPHRFTSPTPF